MFNPLVSYALVRQEIKKLLPNSIFPFLSHRRQLGVTSQTFQNLRICFKGNVALKTLQGAVAGVAQWTDRWPVNQRVTRVTGSIPSQGTCLGCGSDPQLGSRERQPHFDVSLALFLPPFPYV